MSTSQRQGVAAELSDPRPISTFHDRHDPYEPTLYPQQRQQQQTHQRPPSRSATPSTQRSLRRTPNFEASPRPTPTSRPQVHLAAASIGFNLGPAETLAPAPVLVPARAPENPHEATSVLGFVPLSADRQDSHHHRQLSQDISDPDEESSEQPLSHYRPSSPSLRPEQAESLPPVRISKHTHSAVLFALEEALRTPHQFTPDLVEETASMADLMSGGTAAGASNGNPATASFRPAAAPAPTSSPSGIRGPRMIMQERAAREARQRAEAEQQALERSRAEQEARLLEEARKRNAERRPATGVAAGQGTGTETRETSDPQRQGQTAPDATQGRPRASTTTHPTPQRPTHTSSASQQLPQTQPFNTSAPPPQPNTSAQPGDAAGAQGAGGSKPRNSFPHAFERWETLSAHWEGLTSYWIRKLDQNKDELSRDPLNQQLARQVTDLSAAGANLFHAVVELQRLRASSERKFQRWFFETRAELERAQEVNAMLETALEQERRGRADAIRDAVANERGTSKAQQQLTEMRKELAISKEEARRAWEELGRREQEERDRTLSLQSGQPTIVGGVQVVPMTQGAPSRHGSARAAQSYQPEYSYQSERTGSPQTQASTSNAAESSTYYRTQESGQHGASLAPPPAGSEGGYSEGEYVIDANGNFMLDSHGNKIPYAGPPSTYKGSDSDLEEYETPATTNPPSGGLGSQEGPTSPGSDQWTGSYSDPQDYSGQGYGAPGWETVPRHHHPTRLSDVIEEEDERSRASGSHSRV